MIVAGADALAQRLIVTARPRLRAAPVELAEQSFRRRLRVSMHRNLDRHLIADLSRLDIDLLAPKATMQSLSAISSSAIGEEKPPLMPSDHGLPENSP
jgi:hypothetical protein